MTRRIALITTGRADLGLLLPVFEATTALGTLEPALWLTGAHLTPDGAETEHTVAIPPHASIGARVPLPPARTDADMSRAIAIAVAGFTDAIEQSKPDAIVLLGDRFETLAGAVAASACGVPIAHIHGGELTAGAIDNQFRYAITALANLHCVATERARDRLIAMGEAPDAVARTGAPGLDCLAGFEPLGRDEFAREAGLADAGPYLLVTLHATTIDGADPAAQAAQLVGALESIGMPCLVTAANQDPGGDAINSVLQEACARNDWPFTQALGGLYHHAMQHAKAMVGNSSSGIIEAASFGLPVVNIGDRQAGRERSGNVFDCAHDQASIESAVRGALAVDAAGFTNVYGDGGAGVRIADAIASMPLGPAALRKRFEPPGL